MCFSMLYICLIEMLFLVASSGASKYAGKALYLINTVNILKAIHL